MTNLIAFGCSLTYGHGLPDCFIPPYYPGPHPSASAWPSHLAKVKNLNCINQSSPGSSNFEIALAVMSYDFKPDDTCFIMWSYLDRDLIIHDDGSFEKLWPNKKKFRNWDKVNPNQTKIMKFWFNVVFINTWLTQKKIKCYNLAVDLEHSSEIQLNWISDVKFLPIHVNENRSFFPKALDNHHPDVSWHEDLAKKIAHEIGWD